jgi:rSAM/selenodomain-associated transferase 1
MRTLAIFAKQPVPGQVKSRLAAETSAEWAARVADGFLRDTLARFAGVDAERIIAYSPDTAEARHYFAQFEEYRLVAQSNGDLGQRLASFVAHQSAAGPRRLVIIGSDSPTLPVAFVGQAFQMLESADVVLGPATDGGYYLIGMWCDAPRGVRRGASHHFDGIPWSGPRVLSETIARLDAGCRLALLPPWYDVDTLSDWHALQGHIAAMRRANLEPGVPCTEFL